MFVLANIPENYGLDKSFNGYPFSIPARLVIFELKRILVETISATNNIADLIKLRQREGFELLYIQYAPVIFGMGHKLVKSRDTAEDIVQETFVKVWRNISQFDPQKARFSTWVLNIARYTTIDHLRSKHHRQDQKNRGSYFVEYIDKAFSVTFNQDIIGVKGFVLQLEPKYREVIDLVYFNGYTQEETAHILDIPLGTVKTRMRFAIQTLRSIII